MGDALFNKLFRHNFPGKHELIKNIALLSIFDEGNIIQDYKHKSGIIAKSIVWVIYIT
jgi:hypothetical protein